MKFELDDKSGMIKSPAIIFNPELADKEIEVWITTPLVHLEWILKAVAKTKAHLKDKERRASENLENMKISQPKFEINGDNIKLEGVNVSIYPTDSKKAAYLTIKCAENHEKIEQNQKIVDTLTLHLTTHNHHNCNCNLVHTIKDILECKESKS